MGTRGRGRGRESARAGSSASDHMPNVRAREVPASPVTETGPCGRAAGDESNRAEIFRGIASVAPDVAEYWLEAMERIMDDLDCTSEQKLTGAVSLLRDEAYQWLLTGDKTVGKYEAEFLRLSRYARGMVATDCECYVHFEGNLQDELRILIASQREQDFAILVEKAKITDNVNCSERQNSEKERGRSRRDPEPSSSFGRPKKKGRFDEPVQVGASVTITRLQSCANCGRRSGFYLANKRCSAATRGRGQAKNGNGLGRGRGAPGRGAGNVEARQPTLVYAEVQGVTFSTDLVELPFGEFDLILGMDWLVKKRASLDCAVMHVVLKTTEDEEVVVIEERREYLLDAVSALRAKKLVRKGCEVFLAYIDVSDSECPSVENIKTVKDFLDVFPDELPGLPPNHQVKFGIEFLPGIAPVSIAPYRMVRKELMELKAQIQELLD
ncbi:uncharacterized protein LOC108487648 [Gossypium arboreum]|uniref:uncharacterized protein LOC108487648 n=1 Tax=Gossypium arboreum TaxID=29729 RepID=UPI0008193CF1|nr:uncharacterized protein LOC108487648 [Gossypium arboreum]